MGVRLSGSVLGLQRAADAFRRPSSVMHDISVALAEESLDLVRQGWRDQADPSGRGWRPKKVGDGRAILVKRGFLRNSIHRAYANARGFGLATGIPYATFHQRGTSRMARRAFFPFEGIPARWLANYKLATRSVLAKRFLL